MVPQDYAVAVCNGFAKLGVRGLSVLFSSKDFGVGNSTCLTNYGDDRMKFLPMFHASCACFAPQISTITNHIKLRPLRDNCWGDQRRFNLSWIPSGTGGMMVCSSGFH